MLFWSDARNPFCYDSHSMAVNPTMGAVTVTVRMQTDICGTRHYSCILFGAQKGNFTWGKQLPAALNTLSCWFVIGRRTLSPNVLISDSRTAGYDGKGKGKAIPVADREGTRGCETSRLPNFLDYRLTDGCEVVSLTHRPLFAPQEDSWYSFLLEAESILGP
jgi:hypothetical protein